MAHRSPILAAALLALAAGCSRRAPTWPTDGGPPADEGSLPATDAAASDGALPAVCQDAPLPWTTFVHPSSTFRLALPPGTEANAVALTDPDPRESAARLRLAPVAGLVATRRAEGTSPAVEAGQLQEALSKALGSGAILTVRASGAVGQSAEGFPDIKDVIWDVSTAGPTDAAALRNRLLAALLRRPVGALGQLGGSVGQPSWRLLVRLTVQLRSDKQLLVSAAVASSQALQGATTARNTMADLSNGTAVALADKSAVLQCESATTSKIAAADILWIVDESGSMNDNRDDIVNNATALFEKARAAGLDFRMGIAGMKTPGDGVTLGKLCSYGAGAAADDGGEDRFLLPGEQQLFTDCIKNPPYFEGGSEHGLTHGYWAVKRHLPRQAGSPHHIRPNAQLALIFVTDEAPQEAKQGDNHFFGAAGFLEYTDYRKSSCQLSSSKQSQLDAFLTPLTDLLSEAQATVHVIGGVCGNLCNAEIAHGYRELAQRFGGQLGDVCQYQLGDTLQVIVDSIAASASPVKLRHVPITSTLAVAIDGQPLTRNTSSGWAYDANSNTLTFVNVPLPKGATVSTHYRSFR